MKEQTINKIKKSFGACDVASQKIKRNADQWKKGAYKNEIMKKFLEIRGKADDSFRREEIY